MSELFRAELAEVAPKRAVIRLAIASAEVRRLWNTKTFATWLLLEPIFLGLAEPSDALAAIVARDAIASWDTAVLRAVASKLVTSCAVDVDRPMPAHLEAIAGLDGAAIDAYFRAGRAPTATVTVRLKRDGVASHLAPGLRWSSAACDVG